MKLLMKAKIFLLILLFCSNGLKAQNAQSNSYQQIGFESGGMSGWQFYIASKSDSKGKEYRPQEGTFYTPIAEKGLNGNIVPQTPKLWPSDFWKELTDVSPDATVIDCTTDGVSHDPGGIRFKRIDVDAGQVDTYTGISLKSPNGSRSIVRIGNDGTRYYTERMSYTFRVTKETSLIRYYYMMVLEDPGHSLRPYFYAEVSEKGSPLGASPIACSNRTYIADTIMFADLQVVLKNSNSDSKIFYKDWSSNVIDLSSEIGKEVVLSFVTSDCGGSGHFGYAYVDAEFVNSNFLINGVSTDQPCVGDVVNFNYPDAGTFAGETYEWVVRDSMNQIIDVAGANDSIMRCRFPNEGEYNVSLTLRVDNSHVSGCMVERTVSSTVHAQCCLDRSRITIDGVSVDGSVSLCNNQFVHVGFQSGMPMTNPQYEWRFGETTLNEGEPSKSEFVHYQVTNSGRLVVEVSMDNCRNRMRVGVDIAANNCVASSCNDCPSRFSPTPGEKYTLSGWVSAEDQIGRMDSFEKVYILLVFNLIGSDTPDSVKCYPDGNIIDGWQRISKNFVIPQNAEKMRIALKNESSDNRVYFDDIRFHPFNASVKSYVYDPKTLRLAAELDDENYATFYEYDEEGALVRIKKETERGVMTIREARQSKPKNLGNGN